jgi:hypothetical protein
LYVLDEGPKSFPLITDNGFSVVASGRPGKFARRGDMALQNLVCAALHEVGGSFFHIGPLDAVWIREIQDHLAGNGIDKSRFVYLGQVPSLWQELLKIDGAFFLGSAPVAGGRAAIEAQGAGYPVLFFNGEHGGPLAENYSLFADPTLGWRNATDLRRLLREVGPRHAELSAASRLFYAENYSRVPFREAVRGLCAREHELIA